MVIGCRPRTDFKGKEGKVSEEAMKNVDQYGQDEWSKSQRSGGRWEDQRKVGW